MKFKPPRESVLDRFLRYVKIDTQSQEDAEQYPSTQKQFDLLRPLVEELKSLGIADAAIDEYGYVTGTVPSTLPGEGKRPTTTWLPEEIIADEHALQPDAPAENGHLLVGMYDLQTKERLAAYDCTGQRLRNDAIPLVDISREEASRGVVELIGRSED